MLRAENSVKSRKKNKIQTYIISRLILNGTTGVPLTSEVRASAMLLLLTADNHKLRGWSGVQLYVYKRQKSKKAEVKSLR